MNSAVLQLEQVGCHAVGIITPQRQLGLAVRGEIHGRHYHEVVTGRSSSWLARLLRLDPVHRLRVRLGHRLTVSRSPPPPRRRHPCHDAPSCRRQA